MLKIDDVIHITYGQSMMIGKIKRIGSLMATADKHEPGPPYILFKDTVIMVPVGQNQFDLAPTKKEIYFIGGGAFMSELKITDDLYKKYIHAISGLLVVPNLKGMTS